MVCAFLIASCSGTDFLGAKKYVSNGYYVERWFKAPDDQYTVPQGTEFYGAAAEKIKHRFIIKYYIKDGVDNIVLIPEDNMWEVKQEGELNKFGNEFVNRFLYKKRSGKYEVNRNIHSKRKMPIQSCAEDGWCKTYIPDTSVISDGFKYDLNNVLYIKSKELISK